MGFANGDVSNPFYKINLLWLSNNLTLLLRWNLKVGVVTPAEHFLLLILAFGHDHRQIGATADLMNLVRSKRFDQARSSNALFSLSKSTLLEPNSQLSILI